MNYVKEWRSEYKAVPLKRCMQSDVFVGPDGTKTYPDTTRNRIRAAALENLGQPVSIKDIAEICGVSYSYINMRLRGVRPWTAEHKAKINELLKCDVFNNGGNGND